MKAKAFLLGAAILFISASDLMADPGDCVLSPQDFQSMISLDFAHFDQDLSGGGAGWRAIANRGCYIEAAALVETYHLQNLSTLLDWQDRILWWHAGQLYAFDNVYATAILRFQKSYNSKELPSDTFKWDAYVDASIAFLQGDLAKLKQAREILATATDSGAQNNLKIVDSFVRCFGKPYSVAYSPSCQ